MHRNHRIAVAAIAATLAAVSLAGMDPAGASADTRTEHLDALYAGSDPESPARFRIIEERDRLLVNG